ncbi:MAG: hypothetical protein ACK4PG_09205 [Acetobacteraceae bacterium]
MSGVLALAEEVRPLAWNPLPTAPRTAAERFRLSLEAQLATGNWASEERNLRLAFDDAAGALREAGAQVENPFEAGEWQGRFLNDINAAATRLAAPFIAAPLARQADEERRRRELAWDQAVTRLREERPEEAERYLYTHEIRAMARRRAQNAAAEAAAPEDLGGGLGAFAGSVAGVFADPIQVLTLPLGAGRMAGTVLAQVARTAAIEGAIAGATQAVVETRAGPYRQSLGLPDDSLAQVGMAALGGAVIGGGVRALLAGAERLAARAPAGSPLEVQAADGRALAQTQAMDAAATPGAMEQANAHIKALEQALQQQMAGQTVTASLPPPERRVLAAWIEQPPTEREAAAIHAFVQRAIGQADSRVRGISGGWLSEEEARALRAEGLPVGTETARVLVTDRVRHAWLHHGPDAARPDGAPPITAEDIANWRELIRAALDAQPTRTGSGQPAMTYLARDAQGRLVVIEEYRARTGVLAFSNMYRLPDGHGATRLEQVPGMRERLAAARGAPPVPNADPAAARSPEHTSATPGGLAQILPEAAGRFNVYTPTGRAVLVEPRVVPLSSLVPSHGPDGTPNPAYPHAEGLQPRDRGAAPSRDQVRAIAAGLIPERLLPNVEAGMGAPIVHGSDNVVESGNGRVAALTLVHRDPALAHVREAYLAALERAGFDLARIEDPVLVSARVSQLSPAERIAFVREANLRGTAAETLAEAAARDAEAARALLRLWRGGTVDAAANADFLRGFLARLTPEERAGLLDRAGRPLPALAARIERALLMAAYGDALGPIAARMIAGETEGMRGLAAALRNLAGDWAAMRAEIEAGRVPAEYEATPALAEAVSAIAEAQARRLPLAELVLQGDIERPGLTPSGLAMLRAMFPDGDLDRRIKPEVRLTEMLRGYVERARAADAGPMLLDLPPVRTADAIGAAARAEEGAAPTGGRGGETSRTPGEFSTIGDGGLVAEPAAPRAAGEISPADPQAARLRAAAEEARRLARDPATASAELLEAQRIAAERDLMIPEEAGARGARELLDAADDEAAEAAAAAVCLIGSAAS